jgi:hypothetical protein
MGLHHAATAILHTIHVVIESLTKVSNEMILKDLGPI